MIEEVMPPILMYHSVTSGHDGSPWSVGIERFEQQMRWLRRHGFQAVSVRELLQRRRDDRGRRLVGLTFDDGYADFAENALPVLSGLGFTATAFVVAGRPGGESVWSDESRKPLLTTDQMRAMVGAGIEIGSHSLTHLSLPSVADDDLALEVALSREILTQVSGGEVEGFCYPFGHHDGRVLAATQAAGYDYVCAVGYSKFTGRYALPRIYVGNADSPARLWAKAMQYWLRWEYRGPASRMLAQVSARRAGLRPQQVQVPDTEAPDSGRVL